MKWISLILLLSILNSGCDLGNRERDLRNREDSLNQREQQLVAREKSLQAREQQLLQSMDSLHAGHSTRIDSTLAGSWMVTMTCTGSTCAGSAIGDIKTEQWDIFLQDKQIIAKSIVNGKVVRVYSGQQKGNTMELEVTQTASSTTRMLVRVHKVSDTSMEGEREISRQDCKIVYALQLEKD